MKNKDERERPRQEKKYVRKTIASSGNKSYILKSLIKIFRKKKGNFPKVAILGSEENEIQTICIHSTDQHLIIILPFNQPTTV